MSLRYDVLMVTRNRFNAIRLSIPFILTQTRPPSRLIIVDASDDHDKILEEIERMSCGFPVELKILKSKAGIPHQRNIGLPHIQAPIVMMPDDDSLWYLDFAEHVMQIYEKDTHGNIGGVGGNGVRCLPPGIGNDFAAHTYRMSVSERLKQSLDFIPENIEEHIFHDPFDLIGLARRNVKPAEPWMQEEDAIHLSKMSGYRMSFRTNIIRPIGFDEVLGRYAMFEDFDACFGVSKHFLVVEAMKARMHHYKSPEPRTSGMEWGVLQVLNRVYITCKHAPPDSMPRKYLKRFLYYKLCKYMLRIHSRWTQERLLGMYRALPHVQQLLDSPAPKLAQRYSDILKICLQSN